MVNERHEVTDDHDRREEEREVNEPLAHFEFTLLRILREVFLQETIQPQVEWEHDNECREGKTNSCPRIPSEVSLEEIREVDIDVAEDQCAKGDDAHVEENDREKMRKDIARTGSLGVFHEGEGERVCVL